MSSERYSQVVLSNMVLIQNGDKYLFINRVKKDWPGLTLPGGHVETGESLEESVIREAKEETGLSIRNPVLCGVMEWPWENNSRYLAFIYRAETFEGELKESPEGPLVWLSKDDIPGYPQSQDLDRILAIAFSRQTY